MQLSRPLRLPLFLRRMLPTTLVLAMAACGDVAYTQPEQAPDMQALSPAEADAVAPQHAYLFACHDDADCVALPRAGACRNGVKEAVNRHHVAAYYEIFRHKRRPGCTFLLIRDRRAARCDGTTGQCKMMVEHQSPQLPAVFTP